MEEKEIAMRVLRIIEEFEDPKVNYPYSKFSNELKKAIGDVIGSERLQQRLSRRGIHPPSDESPCDSQGKP